jgi:primary-amine oxidase
MNRSRLIASLLSAGAALAALSLSSEAKAAQCASGAAVHVTDVDQLSVNGSRWRFGVDRCPREGLAFTNVRFTPKGGVERLVLYQANIAQIHLPYHPGEPRFHDLSTDTAGLGDMALTLTAPECAGGTLLDGGRVCKQVEDRGYAWKYNGSYAMGEEVVVWMSSQLGRYTYINQWVFQDDGTIEPRVGLTGQLQMYGGSASYLPYGSRLNAESAATPTVGLNHMHNIYYRLDFDMNGSSNDAVDRIEYFQSMVPSPDSSCAVVGQCGRDTLTRLDAEAVDFISPDHYTSWRVLDKVTTNADGRNIGYEIVPEIEGLWSGMTSASEPWSSGELWVTAYNQCELLPFDNVSPYLPAGCAASTAANVTAMTSPAANVNGADLVVWYANRFRHFVRDEDGPEMPIEWVGFHMSPRSFHHQNPTE